MKLKRALAGLLCLVLMLGILPVTALAHDAESASTTVTHADETEQLPQTDGGEPASVTPPPELPTTTHPADMGFSVSYSGNTFTIERTDTCTSVNV